LLTRENSGKNSDSRRRSASRSGWLKKGAKCSREQFRTTAVKVAGPFLSIFAKFYCLFPLKLLERARVTLRRYNMIKHIAKFLACLSIAVAVPLAGQAQTPAQIGAAFAAKDYTKALALTRQAFVVLKPNQAAEAAALIKAILAVTPPEEVGAVVVAAVEANPALGEAIVAAALSVVNRDEQLVILSALNFALSQNPGAFGSLLAFIAGLLSSVEGVTPTTGVLTVPSFNPSNSSSNGVFVSPSTP
jgi:hypothetical protein